MQTNDAGASPVEQRVRPLRWLCQSCDWIGAEDELLTAPSPFQPETTIYGCPKCKAVDDIVGACDEPGCTRESSCGFPTDDGGYRRTCHQHSKWASRPNAEVTGQRSG